MTKETAIKLFNQKQVRCHWDIEKEKWYFSIVDVVEVLTGYSVLIDPSYTLQIDPLKLTPLFSTFLIP